MGLFRGLAMAAASLAVVAACGDDETTPTGSAGSAGSGAGGTGAADGGAGAPTLGTPRVELLVEGAEIPGANGMFFDGQDRLTSRASTALASS